jgi:putative serine protease PepD
VVPADLTIASIAMTEPDTSNQTSGLHRRVPLWITLLASVLALVVGGVIGGVIVAAVRDKPDITSVGCVTTTVARQGLPSVVTIQVSAGNASGSGSGVVIRPDGYIVTNNHVISIAANGGSITVLLSDGEGLPARLTGRDVLTDLAVLKVDRATQLPAMAWGTSSLLRVGQPVVALGAPLGLSSTVTSGIVSALDRSVNVPADNGRTALLVAAIQTDAAINPGNSGGALVDCAGKLVGIPTAGATVPNPQGGTSAGNIGIGFAIPSDSARTLSDELIANGAVTHASFGLAVASISQPAAGLLVLAPSPGGPSDAAGIRAGDIITAVNGQRVQGAEQLQALTLTRRPGDVVDVTFQRAGAEHTAPVTLGGQQSQG